MDDKKYTPDLDEHLEDPFAEKKTDDLDTFEEFNFTDEFPEEFESEKHEEDPFAQPFTPDNDDDLFAREPQRETVEEDPFASKFNPSGDFDDDLFASKDSFKDSFGTQTLDESENMPPETPSTSSKKNWLQRHPFISLAFLAVLVFGGYRFITSIGDGEIVPVASDGNNAPKLEGKQLSQPASTAMKQVDTRLDALEKSLTRISEQLAIIEGTGPRLAQLEQVINKIAEEEKDVEATLKRLDALNKQVTALAMLDERLNSLDAQLKALTSEVDLQTTVSEQTQRAANLSRQAMQAKSAAPVPMVVQAAIPGRAWLLSEMGELITVARGDEVPGYGRVLSIDPVAGTVTMSSETVFREE